MIRTVSSLFRRKSSTKSTESTKSEEPAPPIKPPAPLPWDILRPTNLIAEIEKKDKPVVFLEVANEMERHFLRHRKLCKEVLELQGPYSELEVDWIREFVALVSKDDKQGRFLVEVGEKTRYKHSPTVGCYESVVIKFELKHPETKNVLSNWL